MYWTLQNLKDSEDNQVTLHYGSIFSATTVPERALDMATSLRVKPNEGRTGKHSAQSKTLIITIAQNQSRTGWNTGNGNFIITDQAR
jgi:hypothetical protein